MIVAPPQLIGTAAVGRMFGVPPDRVRINLRAGRAELRPGYLGRIANRHVWNGPELIASLFTSEVALEEVVAALATRDPIDPVEAMLCAAPDCDELAEVVGLCRTHLRRLTAAWRRAPHSSLVTVQLVAMCRWVVERNADLVLDPDFDPWSPVCMSPTCDSPTNTLVWHGPLCARCSAELWGNPALRPRPHHWKRAHAPDPNPV